MKKEIREIIEKNLDKWLLEMPTHPVVRFFMGEVFKELKRENATADPKDIKVAILRCLLIK